MNEIEEFCKADFRLEGDETNTIYTAAVVSYLGELWVVANYFLSPSTGERMPAQLVPLVRMGAIQHPDRPDFVITAPLPKTLLTSQISPELIHEFGVVDVPGMARIRGPESIQ